MCTEPPTLVPDSATAAPAAEPFSAAQIVAAATTPERPSFSPSVQISPARELAQQPAASFTDLLALLDFVNRDKAEMKAEIREEMDKQSQREERRREETEAKLEQLRQASGSNLSSFFSRPLLSVFSRPLC